MSQVELPQLVRPTKELAVDYAKQLFLAGERIDMQVLAASLGVGRTTIYRWVGGREPLIAAILAEFGQIAWEMTHPLVTKTGVDGAIDAARQFMKITSEYAPLTTFARREPEAALRILMDVDGPVAEMIRTGLRESFQRYSPVECAAISDETIEVVVQLGTALEWTPIVIGHEPAIDRAIMLATTVIHNALRPQRQDR